jgi:hypothetical protein
MPLQFRILKTGSRFEKFFKEATLADWIMAFCTTCLLFVAGIAACISYFQWREMHSGGVDTHDLAIAAKAQADATKAEADSMRDLAERSLRQAEATDKLAKQAEISASASIQSARDADISAKATKDMASISAETLKNAKENAQLDQRPWLSVGSLRLTKYQTDSKLETILIFTNSGRSPALHVSIVGSISSLDKKINPTFFNIAPNSDATAYRSVPPQGTDIWTTESIKLIDADEKDKIDHFSHIIWAVGFIRYEDAYGTPHVTQFCGYTRDKIKNSKINEGMDLNLCSDNNGMN